MKMSPEQKKIQENMAVGVITAGGFLGDDERKLPDIIEEDEELMRHYKLDYDEVAGKLEFFLEEGKKGLGEFISVDSTWLVRTEEARGHLPCPFGDGLQRKITCETVLEETGEKLLFSTFSLHLLKEHHFHQGKGSPFRIDPLQLKKVLKL